MSDSPADLTHVLIVVFPARATHDARCFSIGCYLIGKVYGQMRVSEGTLPLGVKPSKEGRNKKPNRTGRTAPNR